MKIMKSLKERNKVRERFGFAPLTESEHKLEQKGLRQTYHNSETGTFEFSATPLSNAKTQLVTAESFEEAVNKLD